MLRRFVSISSLACYSQAAANGHTTRRNNTTSTAGTLRKFSPKDASTWGLDSRRSAKEEARRLLPLLRPYLRPDWQQTADDETQETLEMCLREKRYRLLYDMQINDVEMEAPEETLKQYITTICKIKLSQPRDQIERRCGGDSVQECIMSHFMDDASPQTMQHSYALALRGTSGIGKTYLAFCYPAGATREKYKELHWCHVCVYAGFNSECPLTSKENTFLSKNNERANTAASTATAGEVAANAVALVVMARVVGQLAALIAAGCPDRADGVDLHLFAPNVSADAFLDSHPIQYNDITFMLMRCAVQQLCTIRKTRSSSRKMTVLVNVDEAQFLDKQVNVKGGEPLTGARFALRILRMLQLAVTNADESIALLGMSTGIDPEVSLTNKTEGINSPIAEELLSRDECVELALGYQSSADQPLRPSERIMAAHRLYPRVRDVLLAVNRKKNVPVSVFIKTAENAALLIKHHITQEPLSYHDIPHGLHVLNGTVSFAIPYLDVAVWPYMLSVLGTEDATINMSLAPYTVNNTATVFTCYGFEKSAFDVLWFTMKMYFNGSDVLKEVGAVFRKQQTYLTTALGLSTSTTLNMIGCQSQLDSNEVPHPFTTNENLQLSTDFTHEYNRLKNDGDALLLYLGKGSAADYMLLRMDGGKIYVWYGDAKTHVGQKRKAKPSTCVEGDARVLRTKLDDVHKALRRLLPTVDHTYHCSIITHVAMAKDTVESLRDDHNVTVLCPTTFVCEPWSSILFGEAKARNDAVESKHKTLYKMSQYL